MKNEEFKEIITPVYKLINTCNDTLRIYISSGEDVRCMPIGSINKTIESCREILSEMDKFLKADLYHIIGMTDFDAIQMSQFISATKDLMKYRCAVKMFSGLKPVPELYGMKETHVYKLSSGKKLCKDGKINKYY